ncbi:hypothetical protein MGG_14195 [Pyricularia oryzae 70-15]|uniref:Uncharacterized protein n=3 Tax=Pyricularia oryzae TaxID=318829 RepID=G4NJP8_PYRO7|nr:uncharacterized protein MGG_14195 [Pyricularia oryzae 70-15]EHA45715.1 hypothetical protein MGG_14195 [Pyricularia oryzae 70-15]ELQ43743.1 hypothetical protein OOU_Y34scaffold00137g1 [Pyricularia oryzae Y34]KAI7908888.1 hypothetical protein M0657_012092 [Pyricularia oryzae]
MPLSNQHRRALRGLYNWRMFACVVVLLAFTILAVAFLVSSIPNSGNGSTSSSAHGIDHTPTKATTVNTPTHQLVNFDEPERKNDDANPMSRNLWFSTCSEIPTSSAWCTSPAFRPRAVGEKPSKITNAPLPVPATGQT